MRTIAVLVISSTLAAGAFAAEVTCRGALVNINQPHGAPPLGIVFDDSGDFSCAIDRRGAGHDPLKPCEVGQRCVVSGTFEADGRTYNIQTLSRVERLK